MAIYKSTAAVLAAFLIVPVQNTLAAERLFGTNLLEHCETDDSFCFGFVTGAAIGIHVGSGMYGMKIRDVVWCVPEGADGISASQHVAVVQKYLRDHPEKLHRPAEELVAEALNQAFPCR